MPHLTIKLPDVGEGTAEAELAAWHVKVGDTVAEDQNLADITTEKATVEIPSPAAGKVVSLRGTPGDVIAVGSPLIVLEVEGAVRQEEKRPAVAAAPTPAPKPTPAESSAGQQGLAAPAVRQRARELKIDLSKVTGSGPEGRILHKDLDAHLASQRRPESASPFLRREGPNEVVEEIKVIGIRRKIAERMQESKRHIPHFAYVEEVDVTALEKLRAELNGSQTAPRLKLSLLPFLMRAMTEAVAEFPQVNALFDDAAGTLYQYKAVHMGIATQTDKGLLVPVIFNAATKDLWGLAAEIIRLADAARKGSIDRKELSGSTMTVTSLGRLGGIMSTPVINRPEVAIIGVNKIAERPVVVDGQVVVRSIMNLSSSFDHRIVDGHVAASYIQRVKTLLEQPAKLHKA